MIGDEAVLAGTIIRDHYDGEIRFQDTRHLVSYLLLEDTRREMLEATKGRAAWEYQWAPGMIESSVTAIRLGAILARRFDLATPRALLAHRDNPLAYHRDLKRPYPCTNLTLLFAWGCSGGELVFPERGLGFAPNDGWALAFDGQEIHGVAPMRLAKDGFRLSITFYSPVDE